MRVGSCFHWVWSKAREGWGGVNAFFKRFCFCVYLRSGGCDGPDEESLQRERRFVPVVFTVTCVVPTCVHESRSVPSPSQMHHNMLVVVHCDHLSKTLAISRNDSEETLTGKRSVVGECFIRRATTVE